MLDHILKTAQTFENTHGTPPDIIYINPSHYESLCKHYPALFFASQNVRPGFRIVILPSCMLIHPEAALQSATSHFSRVA